MSNKKKQILRDSLLVGGLLIIVFIVFAVYYSYKKEGEVALVLYDNDVLFEINMENGEFKGLTSVYNTDEMPVIIKKDLIVNELIFTDLIEGEGVLVYQDEINKKDYYFVKGNLGYVKIYYNQVTKKMKVVEETSPYNICSKQGESNDAPIVCLPNYITIKFLDHELDSVI